MFGENMVIRAKPPQKKPVKKPSGSRFAFIRTFTDRYYRDPYKWGVIKCVAFFATSVFVARTLCELDILPAETQSSLASRSAY